MASCQACAGNDAGEGACMTSLINAAQFGLQHCTIFIRIHTERDDHSA